jgi:hypothetical protein
MIAALVGVVAFFAVAPRLARRSLVTLVTHVTHVTIVAIVGSAAGHASGAVEEVAPSSTTDPGHWSFAAVPRLTLNADEGVGLGARGVVYWHRFDQRPYKTAISFQLWATTRLVQQHYLRVDAIDAFNVPLRIESELGFFSTLTQPYCGLSFAPCADDAAHRLRSTEPYASAQGRWRVARGPWFHETYKAEVFAGWRGTWYVPGTLFFDDDGDGAPDLYPAPGSTYARAFPAGEPGLASVVQAGVAVDTRDNEPSPRRGFFVDASVRGAGPVTGSAFSFGGVDVTARLYAPLPVETAPGRPLVVAQRVIVDGVTGDAPVRERMRFGGLVDAQGLGGQDTARGVRLSRYPGRFRASHQIELRADVGHVDVGDNDLAFVVAGFVDGGVALFGGAVDDDARLLLGAGGSLRVIWNENFVFRIDLAASPEEPGRVGFYTAPNHTF